MGKIEEAIKKINTEIQKEPNNRYLALVGENIIDCIMTDDDAEKVLQEGKTLAEAMKAIMKEASKKKQGSVAVLQDAEVYRIAQAFFSLNPQAPAEKKCVALSLEDFL